MTLDVKEDEGTELADQGLRLRFIRFGGSSEKW